MVVLLKSLTAPEHEVFLFDGNAHSITKHEVAEFVGKNDTKLVGIGAMTQAARAYAVAGAIRATGAKVVFGGSHVREVPDESLGRKNRCATANGSTYCGAIAKC